jgi:hypothetical protein
MGFVKLKTFTRGSLVPRQPRAKINNRYAVEQRKFLCSEIATSYKPVIVKDQMLYRCVK